MSRGFVSDLPIEAHGLRKLYRGRAAVDGVDLVVRPGEIYGFLGPNGAGKTTTMRMLLGLVRPDGGTIRLFGSDPGHDELAARAGVAGIIEEPRLYSYLSGRRNLKLFASYDRLGARPEAIEEALELVELRERASDRVSEYSQGMRQRLGIAACLVRRPRLMLLDEPANGLDPSGIRFLRRLLRDLAERGITVFLSSHLLAEVQELCERVAIISAGKVVYEGGLEELRAQAGRRYRLSASDRLRALAASEATSGVSDVTAVGEQIEFTIDGDDALLRLTHALVEARVVIHELAPEQLTLERVFFELTERSPAVEQVAA